MSTANQDLAAMLREDAEGWERISDDPKDVFSITARLERKAAQIVEGIVSTVDLLKQAHSAIVETKQGFLRLLRQQEADKARILELEEDLEKLTWENVRIKTLADVAEGRVRDINATEARAVAGRCIRLEKQISELEVELQSRDTCSVCGAALLPSKTPPHCLDCVPREDDPS